MPTKSDKQSLESVGTAFHSSQRSISRARKHIDDLEAAISSLNDRRGTIPIIEETYGEGLKKVVKLIPGNFNPAEFDVLTSIAVDAIYNLRASLDQSIYAVASVNKIHGNGRIPSRPRVAFPLEYCETEVKKRTSKLCCAAKLPSDFERDILSFTPYFDKNRVEPNWLYGLNKAANINKHRVLSTVDIRCNENSIRINFAPISGKIAVVKNIPPPMTLPSLQLNAFCYSLDSQAPIGQNEIGLFSCDLGFDANYNVEVSVDVKFDKIKGLEGSSCVYTLKRIVEVCSAVVGQFGRTCVANGLCI